MHLHSRRFGNSGSDLIFLHGLLGSSANWSGVAQSFAKRYRVHVLDLRNHGASPHADTMSYAEMAGDVAQYIHGHCQNHAPVLIGHSMGGKVAMELALSQPDFVRALVVEDIAPVTYEHDYQFIIDSMLSLPLASLKSRADADTLLAEQLDDAGMRAFLLQNLAREDRTWRWKPNLSAISAAMSGIHSFRSDWESPFDGPSCFIHGSDSGYVGDREISAIPVLFSDAEIHSVDGVGHWVHSEAKDSFISILDGFLSRNNEM